MRAVLFAVLGIAHGEHDAQRAIYAIRSGGAERDAGKKQARFEKIADGPAGGAVE